MEGSDAETGQNCSNDQTAPTTATRKVGNGMDEFKDGRKQLLLELKEDAERLLLLNRLDFRVLECLPSRFPPMAQRR